MNWHELTQDEIDGLGDHEFLIDIQPDTVPHQGARDGNALIRIQRPGWSWIIVDKRGRGRKDKSPRVHAGPADTREAALADAIAKLMELRA